MSKDQTYGALTGAKGAQTRHEEHDRDEQMHGQGANPKPTRSGISARSSAPAAYNTSGMESALGALADKTHKPRRR